MDEAADTLSARIRSKIEGMNSLCNVSIEGAWVVLEVRLEDFSLSHLAHLVEQNSASIVDLFTYADEETAKTFVGFRIDREDASNVVRSLERFNYTVAFYFQKQGLTDETMKKRLDELMYYIEM